MVWGAIENVCGVSTACGHTEGICFFTKHSWDLARLEAESVCSAAS